VEIDRGQGTWFGDLAQQRGDSVVDVGSLAACRVEPPVLSRIL